MDFPDLPADFNSGLAIVYILDSIKKELINARLDNNFEKRKKILISYWMELSSLAKPPMVNANLWLWNRVEEGLKEINKAKALKKGSVSTEWVDAFDDWELFLRQVQQDVGVGMPRSDPRFVMGK